MIVSIKRLLQRICSKSSRAIPRMKRRRALFLWPMILFRQHVLGLGILKHYAFSRLAGTGSFLSIAFSSTLVVLEQRGKQELCRAMRVYFAIAVCTRLLVARAFSFSCNDDSKGKSSIMWHLVYLAISSCDAGGRLNKHPASLYRTCAPKQKKKRRKASVHNHPVCVPVYAIATTLSLTRETTAQIVPDP